MDADLLRDFFARFGNERTYDGPGAVGDRADLLEALAALGLDIAHEGIPPDDTPHAAIIAIEGLELDVFVVPLAELPSGVRASLSGAAGTSVQSLHELNDSERVGAAARVMAATGVLTYEEYEDGWEELVEEWDEDSLPDPDEFAELSEVLTPALAGTSRSGTGADPRRFARAITRSLGVWRV